MKRWRNGVWRPSPVAGALLVANTAVFLLQALQGPAGQEWIVRYGLIPAVLFQGDRFSIPGAPAPYALTLLSSSFLHGNLAHLVVNLAFIAVLGSMVERAIGGWRFAAIWTAGVAVGGGCHALLNSGSIIPTIGGQRGCGWSHRRGDGRRLGGAGGRRPLALGSTVRRSGPPAGAS